MDKENQPVDQDAKTANKNIKPSTEKSTEKATPEASNAKKPVQTLAWAIAIIAGVMLVGLYLISAAENNTEVGSENVEEEVINANCTASECLAKIEVGDEVAKITEVIGVEPEIDETSGTAKWKLSNKEGLSREKSGDGYILQATVNKDSIANKDADFSIFSELKKELEGGESFTYDELVERLGGIKGTLAGKTSTSKRYMWVDGHDQTFSATFSDKDGHCSIISLR